MMLCILLQAHRSWFLHCQTHKAGKEVWTETGLTGREKVTSDQEAAAASYPPKLQIELSVLNNFISQMKWNVLLKVTINGEISSD